jgi:hypothetical protein
MGDVFMKINVHEVGAQKRYLGFSRNQIYRSDGLHFCSVFSNQQWYVEQQSITFTR